MVLLWVPAALGQQDQSQDQNQQPDEGQPSEPIPAYRSPLASASNNYNGTNTSSQQIIPDTSSLSGFQNFGLGMPNQRSYWQPHIEGYIAGDSNGIQSPTGNSWSTFGIISGGVDVQRTSGVSNLTLSYAGSEMFSNQSAIRDTSFQSLSLNERYTFHRMAISAIDDFTYLPRDAFGFASLTGSLVPGTTGAGGLGSAFTPGQSILSAQSESIGNASDAEVDFFLSGRSSLTFVGGYSLLHYLSSDVLDYHSAIFQGGYNYQMTRKDTVAAFYRYDGIDYSNSNQSITSHSGELSYGRRVTGRLAFQIAGGPQITLAKVAISGTPTAGGSSGTGSVTEIGWTLNTSLNWQTERGSFGAQYFHGVTGGSGLLGGGINDTGTGSVSRQLSRTFSGGLTGGYSRIRGVPLSTIVPGASLNERYDYAFGGANLGHPLSRTLGLTLSYEVEYQTSDTGICVGTVCGSNIVVHVVSLGVTWKDRPLLF
jgi:hypothetical protein